MEVASLSNCKRLFELSEWIPSETSVLETSDGVIPPAYSAGYLLRKLPDYCPLQRRTNGTWFIYPNEINPKEITADTPEDALALLAIKLFEEGVLTK